MGVCLLIIIVGVSRFISYMRKQGGKLSLTRLGSCVVVEGKSTSGDELSTEFGKERYRLKENLKGVIGVSVLKYAIPVMMGHHLSDQLDICLIKVTL